MSNENNKWELGLYSSITPFISFRKRESFYTDRVSEGTLYSKVQKGRDFQKKNSQLVHFIIRKSGRKREVNLSWLKHDGTREERQFPHICYNKSYYTSKRREISRNLQKTVCDQRWES